MIYKVRALTKYFFCSVPPPSSPKKEQYNWAFSTTPPEHILLLMFCDIEHTELFKLNIEVCINATLACAFFCQHGSQPKNIY